jgi:hypothetical protein
MTRLMYTMTLKSHTLRDTLSRAKARGVTQLLGHATYQWRDSNHVRLKPLPLSFSHVSLFLLISKWAPKFVKLEMYDL